MSISSVFNDFLAAEGDPARGCHNGAVADAPRPDLDLGLFETLLVLDGRPVELEAHLARLAASLAELFPERPAPDLREEVESPAQRIDSGSLKAVVAPTAGTALRAQIEVRAPRSRGEPVGLRCIPVPGGLGAHKWADRSQIEKTQARLPRGSLPLIVDTDGAVLETSRANLFAVHDGTLLTPPTDGRILPGITRMRTIEIAVAAGVDTHETELCGADLLAAEEVFLTGSVRGVERATALDGIELSGPGEVGALVAAEMRRRWNSVPVG